MIITKSKQQKINIATPIVWAGPGMINQFAGNISKLVESINLTAQECGENFIIEKAILNIHSAKRNQLLNHFSNVEIK